MKIIRPNAITEAMLLYSSVSEPDTVSGETAWSATEINADGDERFIGAPSATVTISNANPAVVTWSGHVLAEDTEVVFSTTGSLPDGITAGATYFVRSRLTASTFTISATKGGRQVRTSSAGSGTHTATAKVHQIFQSALGSRSTVTLTIASPCVVTWTAHGLSADQPVVFTTTGALPTGLTAGTTYYVKSPGTDTFQVSATAGGSAINTSGSQSGTHTAGSGALAVNYNLPPLQNPDEWVPTFATNRWAMFDEVNGSSTSNAESLRVTLQPGSFDAISVHEADANDLQAWLQINWGTVTADAGTDKVTYTAHGFANGTQVAFWPNSDSDVLPAPLVEGTVYYVVSTATNDFQVAATEGGSAINLTTAGTGTIKCGQVVWTYSIDLANNTTVGDWYAYFREPVLQLGEVAVTDIVDAALLTLPAYAAGVLTVKLTRTGGSVSIGALVVGTGFELGETYPGAQAGIKDYSSIDRDPDFGTLDIVERDYTKKIRADVRVASTDVDAVAAVLTAYRARPLVLIGAGNVYASLVVRGLVTDWEISLEDPSPLWSRLRLEAEGLI